MAVVPVLKRGGFGHCDTCLNCFLIKLLKNVTLCGAFLEKRLEATAFARQGGPAVVSYIRDFEATTLASKLNSRGLEILFINKKLNCFLHYY